MTSPTKIWFTRNDGTDPAGRSGGVDILMNSVQACNDVFSMKSSTWDVAIWAEVELVL